MQPRGLAPVGLSAAAVRGVRSQACWEAGVPRDVYPGIYTGEVYLGIYPTYIPGRLVCASLQHSQVLEEEA